MGSRGGRNGQGLCLPRHRLLCGSPALACKFLHHRAEWTKNTLTLTLTHACLSHPRRVNPICCLTCCNPCGKTHTHTDRVAPPSPDTHTQRHACASQHLTQSGCVRVGGTERRLSVFVLSTCLFQLNNTKTESCLSVPPTGTYPDLTPTHPQSPSIPRHAFAPNTGQSLSLSKQTLVSTGRVRQL